jgi:hypothetical protein
MVFAVVIWAIVLADSVDNPVTSYWIRLGGAPATAWKMVLRALSGQ